MKPRPLFQKLLPTLFEDDRFLAVDKPAGIDVGGLAEKGVTGLIELLVERRAFEATPPPSPARPGAPELHVVNRLSRYESGVLILAKDAEAAAFVRNALKAQRVEQEYLAVVIGRMNERQVTLDAAAGASRGRSRGGPVPRRTVPGKSGAAGVMAAAGAAPRCPTTLTRLQQSERRALVRCRVAVANTHALRAQLRAVRLRLLGDNVHDRAPRPQQNADTRLHLAKMTFHHPTLRTRIAIASPAPQAFPAALDGGFDIERPLRAALVRRIGVLADSGTDCCRLLTGMCEDFPGLNVEKYGDLLVFQILSERADDRELLHRVARWYRDTLNIWAVYDKPFLRERAKADDTVARRLTSAKPLWGDPVPPEIEVRERGLRFAIRPYDGFNVGLFLDHRENRSRVRRMAAGADVLNLFAYTCGFSVAAAAGGAKSTTSVDLSPKHLEWGRTNFALNGLDVAAHLFIRSDAIDFLQRAKRQGKSYDLIILDPPSFAHGRGSSEDFSIMTDLPAMVSAAVEVLRPGGTMIVSTNHRKMSPKGLRERVLRGAAGRSCKVTATPPLPPDFAADRDYAKTIYVKC